MAGRAQPRVLLLIGDEVGGVEFHRAAMPAHVAALNGYPVHWRSIHAPDRKPLLQQADVVVFVRTRWRPEHLHLAYQWLDRARSEHRAILNDLDDDLLNAHIEAHTLATWANYPPAEVTAMRAGARALARASDGLTTTTPVLRDRLAAIVPGPIEVVPNMLSLVWWRNSLAGHPRTLPPPVIGWTGGDRPAADFAPMLTAWAAIARAYPAVHFVVGCGQEPEGLRAAIPAARLTVRGWCAPQDLPRQWRDIDIACLPLADNAFNATKSPLKAIEAGAAGAAVVASPTVYRATLRAGIDALLADHTADAWEAALRRLLDDPKLRRTLARRWSGLVAQRYNLDRAWAQWPAAWTRLYYAAWPEESPGLTTAGGVGYTVCNPH